MDSQANGHANGHGSDGPHGDGVIPVGADERALDGDAFATVGEWLAARRRALNLKREDVELATRVREDYLAAIEDMDPRRMPAGPYAPGFVRTYAIHLELDPEAVAARFREEMSPRRLRTPHATRARVPIKITVPPRLVVALLVVASLAGLVALGWRPRDIQEVSVPAVPEGLSQWVAADVQSRRSSAAPELVVGPDLALRARVPVWLDARNDNGEVLVSRTLSAGEIWVAPRIPGVLVSADNGAAVEVLLNGLSQGRLGSAGLPVTDWRADSARPLTAPQPPAAVVEALVEEAAGVAEGDAGTVAAGEAAALSADVAEVDESERMLNDLEAEDSLVSPDLSAETITQEALPDIVINNQGFIPSDPDEAAAAEGRAPDAEPAADVPPAE